MAKKIIIPAVKSAANQKLQQDQAIKDNIRIIDELRDLIPPLQGEEFRQLQDNILKQGCREPILLWRNGTDYVLVDGHNRYRICTENNIKFDFRLLHFEDIGKAKHWMIENQLGRRNLTPEQASYLRGLRYESEKMDNRGYGQVESKGQNVLSTSERIAKEYNVSEKTIKRDAKFARGLDAVGSKNPELKRDLLAGDVKARKADIQKLADVPAEEIGVIDKPEDIAKAVTKSSPKTDTAPSDPKKEAFVHHRKEILRALELVGKKMDAPSYDNLIAKLDELKAILEI
ncbi:hypothetical protein FUAX_46450 (plasmid) [Fulvitalea axinellae]|uniref:ParB/Sulfiredoxin domain-containing protein n=1 Tax=Fulvitalea axinellae TaxID=1182444 RepID=A0AAU9CW29_9BACT|nr:hypothetical protein FUAX_46450 [Fulvitalea axinellae]